MTTFFISPGIDLIKEMECAVRPYDGGSLADPLWIIRHGFNHDLLNWLAEETRAQVHPHFWKVPLDEDEFEMDLALRIDFHRDDEAVAFKLRWSDECFQAEVEPKTDLQIVKAMLRDALNDADVGDKDYKPAIRFVYEPDGEAEEAWDVRADVDSDKLAATVIAFFAAAPVRGDTTATVGQTHFYTLDKPAGDSGE